MRVATFDGGGIKGALPSAAVDRLDSTVPGWSGKADALMGASTGALIAAGIACGLPGSDILDLYGDRGADIFRSRGWLDQVSGSLDEGFRANYSGEGVEEVLEDVFADRALGDTEIPLIIPAFNLTTWEPYFFKSWPGSPDRDLLLCDVLRATTAAPTFFPAHKIEDRGLFVDGGIFNNNPCDSAVAEALDRGAAPEDIRVLSFGCGKVPHPGVTDRADWGYLQWLKPPPHLLDALFDSAVSCSSFRARRALGPRFYRLNPELPRVIEMDDPTAVPELVALGQALDLDEMVAWLKVHWLDETGVAA